VLNNWLELRSDAAKICLSFRRPIPERTDSIGPWLMNVSFLSWLGSLTTSTLVLLFQSGDFNLKCDQTLLIHLLITVLVAEHGSWIFDGALAVLSRRVRTTGEIEVRKEEYSVRRRYLQNIGLSGTGLEITGDTTEKRRERVAGEDSIGFWGEKSVDGEVTEGREILSRGWEKKKVQ
jgi:anoctamin-10